VLLMLFVGAAYTVTALQVLVWMPDNVSDYRIYSSSNHPKVDFQWISILLQHLKRKLISKPVRWWIGSILRLTLYLQELFIYITWLN